MSKKIKLLVAKDNDVNEKIERATQTLDRTIGFINTCDNKTSIVLTAIGVLLTIILTNDGFDTILRIMQKCFEKKAFCDIFYFCGFTISLVIMLLGLYDLGSVLIGRTNPKTAGLDLYSSNIFFLGISKKVCFDTYNKSFQKMNSQEFLEELIAEIYINAKIANLKYAKYNKGLKKTVIGFGAFVCLLLVGIVIY